jgi:hypothetical protein
MKYAIVGNGPVTSDIAAQIDGCDFVIRMNLCTSHGDWTGTRTDCIALGNIGEHAASIMRAESNPHIVDVPEVWLGHNPLLHAEIAEAVEKISATTASYFDDFSILASGPDFSRKRLHILDYYTGAALMAKLRAHQEMPFLLASVGMSVIEEVVQVLAQPGDLVLVAGFTHRGWWGHPWDAERAVIDDYARRGLIRRIG